MAAYMPQAISFLGLLVMLGLAWVCSENRKAVQWRPVIWAVGLQLALALLILQTRFGPWLFNYVKQGFDVITDASTAGASFVFGNLTQFFLIEHVLTPGATGMEQQGPFAISAVIAFNVLPVIIFVSALAAILQHVGIIQLVVRAMAWLMQRTMKTSGAETFGVALLAFLGIESVSALGSYLGRMTRSEIFVLMTGFLATIAASVMVAYAGFGAEPGHLLAASIMSAPAALAMAKIIIPETGTPETSGITRVDIPRESHSIFDSITLGTQRGVQMALSVGSMLIVFVGLIYLVNLFTVGITGQSLTSLLGWGFRPLAWVMGIPTQDVAVVAELLATKSVFNEFLAYQQLQPLIAEGQLSPRSVTIATYALCGFANPGSLGILIGALASLVPERRDEVAKLSLRAFVAGTLAAFSTACIAGMLTHG